MSDLKQQFDDAVNYIQTAEGDFKPSNELKLEFYGLYKQGTCGSVKTGRPYVWDVAGRAKWDAWHGHGDMKQADAKQRYVALVAELSSNGSNDGGDAAEAQADKRAKDAAQSPPGQEPVAAARRSSFPAVSAAASIASQAEPPRRS